MMLSHDENTIIASTVPDFGYELRRILALVGIRIGSSAFCKRPTTFFPPYPEMSRHLSCYA